MSSLVERLRIRSDKRPLYSDGGSDDDDFILSKRKSASKPEEKPAERIDRDDAKEDACQSCGEGGSLLCCRTCTYSFHQKCLIYPIKASATDSWTCPECVSPLNEIDKILDCETRATAVDDVNVSHSGSKKAGVKHYLVKWKGLSYLHSTWVPEEEFKKACKVNPRLRTRLNTFQKQMNSMNGADDDWIAIRPEWTTVDRIIATRKIGDEREYFVKWRELPYDECSWEVKSDISTFQPQIERFNMIQSRGSKKFRSKNKNLIRDSKDPKIKEKELQPFEEKKVFRHIEKKIEFQQFEKSPEFISGGTLHPYQLEGLNFLRYSWFKSTHVILADEMGLGKTIQSIAFLASLFEDNISPHLVIAPLSTLRNWEREFLTWAPQMNVVMYFGSAQARTVIRNYEFFLPKGKTKKHRKKKSFKDVKPKRQAKRTMFDVLLTSYEMINMDSASLKSINWQCMIVDEGHRLKNKESKLFLQLKLFNAKHRVLLTGTPLQNNLDELFMLMHFLDDGKFPSIEDFQKEFKDINQEEQIARLHKLLAPHLLRRVKKDVMKDLPPKKELILRVDLSSKQKEYYKAILTRNYQILARRGGPQISLINVVMELRKLCCHVFMLEGVEPETEPLNANEGLKQLLDSSGKMQLLDKMMTKLKEQGHRVLIYSQFQHMLDLLEDYMTYKKWIYERIDGRIGGAERQIRIDRFNAKSSTRFCFLLSTRAGGLGINLATADTVIIYDSDWNPHADLQAMARAHRLGQTNKVMIYRLVTRGTIEEKMMQMTKKKMILEHLVVGRLKTQTVNQEELDDIIRYGSKDLFADESDGPGNTRQIHYDDGAIDRLLNRDEIDAEDASVDDEDDDLLKAFKVANFKYIDEVEAAAAREEEAKRQSMAENGFTSNPDRANYWEELLRDRYEVIQIEESTTMGKGKRNRKQMPATEEDEPAETGSDDDDYSFEEELSDTDVGLPGQTSGRRGQLSRKRCRGNLFPTCLYYLLYQRYHLRSIVYKLKATFAVDLAEPHALMEGEGRSFRVRGFNQNQRAAFLQLLMRFGFGKFDWKEFVPRLKGKSMQEVHDYGRLFMEHLTEELNDSPTFSDGVPKEGLRVDEVLVRLGTIQSIEEKLSFLSENPGTPLFAEGIQSWFPGLKGRIWREEHDSLLLKAILKHGYARWQYIVEDKDFGLAEIVRQELNLPVINGPFTGAGNQVIDSSKTGNSGSSEAPKANQSNLDYSMLYQFREVQRRIVDFIRKRYHLLDKAINAELLREKNGGAKFSETTHDSDIDPKATEILSSEPAEPSTLSKELPIMEPIDLQESACDDNSGRLEMIRLYNGMCGVIESNTPDALHAYFGNSSAASNLSKNLQQLEIIYEDVHRILTVSTQNSAMESSDVKLAEGSEHQSESKLGRTSETENIHAEVKVANTSVCEESTNSQASDKKKAGDIGDESSNS
ncbi:CHD3-type chromatin-remodeling factor PICKLE isoform X2 [Dendrobium catenatum]|uniref:CHD3-type chromatin-remodeling factor PICKLE isoform X2 n=1 Tax=Dendrobium catenatum TaxID=906689 RepID=UPI0009F46997|nr:CHD3-type chromatin-remodeling factor PICKLE isoform X2 [Dendrobium catenatum]